MRYLDVTAAMDEEASARNPRMPRDVRLNVIGNEPVPIAMVDDPYAEVVV